MKTCRFELTLPNGLFHCAADEHGWAWLWEHDEINDPCPCEKFIEGEPTKLEHELKSTEFWKVAGELIREEDWEKWKTKSGQR